MGDTLVRASLPSVAAPETSALRAPTAPAPSITTRILDLIDIRRRDYVVLGDVRTFGADALKPPEATGLQGVSPTGEPWRVSRMTSARAHELEQQGLRVVEDYEVAPPVMAASKEPVFEADNLLARDVHEINELNALGPAFEGEGGLFISVDTGVARHRDLPPTSRFDNVYTDAPEDPQADSGRHGTHTSGSAVARGNPAEGGTRGMAPRAELAGIQVLGEGGRGSLSSILKGIERAVEYARAHDGFVVVNMSLGATSRDPANDPMVQAIERATREHGILFTVSAGNRGPSEGTIGTPGVTPMAITVGAMDHNGTLDPRDDKVARFSSRDVPTGSKPTIVARGVGVRSTIPGDAYASFNGTSMATPIAGGASLALGQGLLAMYRRGELRVDPRELVKTGEFQRIVAETSLDNPAVASNVEGAGDLRIMAAYRAFVARFGTANTSGPAPYVPGTRSAPTRVEESRYQVPF